MKKTLLALALSQVISSAAIASELWQPLSQARSQESVSKQLYRLDQAALLARLMHGDKNLVITLPLPSGELVKFKLQASQVMSNGLAEKFPQIKTFTGFDIENPANTGRFDYGPKGFYGVFNYQGQRIYVDPEQQENVYVSYKDKNAHSHSKIKQGAPIKRAHSLIQHRDLKVLMQNQSTEQSEAIPNSHITYRIAFATTGEYAQYHGGSKDKVMAALVTMVNRLNDVYERDLAMRFELVADNDKLIFLDPEADPFANTDQDIDILSEKINQLIGEQSYDIGHLVGTGGGGLAGFEVVCTEYKAEGITGSEEPSNDAFHIDYVAHEIGHQLGADHTFNGQQGACIGNRAENSAYEPGSGSTIMGYTGICDEQDLQPNSDPYFHIHSLDQMNTFSRLGAGKTCGVHKDRASAQPSVDAGKDYVIPARTPFKLVGSATSTSGEALTYSWQQFNLGPASADKQQDAVDDGQRPLFRTFNPVAEPTRTVPQISDVLTGTLNFGEAYATTNRNLDFRLIVRDGKGGVSDDAMQIKVIANDQGFSVTLPDASSAWRTSEQLVKWHTAGTEQAPVACEKVDILLSEDAGQSFKKVLAEGVANSGEYTVQLENIVTEQARLQVKCSDNIFFAVNTGNFTISVGEGSGEEQPPKITGQKPLELDEDTALEVKLSDLTMATDKALDSLTLQAGDNYSIDKNTIVPSADFNGELTVPVTVMRGKLSSEPFQLKVTVKAVNDMPEPQNDSFEVEYQAQQVTLDVLNNDLDKDADKLTIDSVEYSGQGTVSIRDGKLVYSAANDFSGDDAFKYTVTDGKGGSSFAVVTVTVKGNPNPDNGDDDDKDDSGSFGILSLLSLLALFTRRVKRG